MPVAHYDDVIVAEVPENVGFDTVPAGLNVPANVVEDPSNPKCILSIDNVSSAIVVVAALGIACSVKLGRVTAVGVLAVKLPAVHPNVRVSLDTVAVKLGSVQEAFVPAVTEPPPEALDATKGWSLLSD